jgi:putative ABC transport system permease protein
VGYALTYVFAVDHALLVAAIVALMCLVAAHAALGRVQRAPRGSFLLSALALGSSTFIVTAVVCGVIIHAERWYTARVAIPIAGMILGNSLTAVALALDRLLEEVRGRADELELRLALGYAPWEAIRPHVRSALRAAMTPTINALMVVGLVSLPGMMTGQILAGAEPLRAARYQIVVMMMLAAAVAGAALLAIALSYRRCFDDDQALRRDL